MTRTIYSLSAFAFAATCALVPVHTASADDKPTPAQIEQAKAAYNEGKALHDQGKLPEAIEKFKESYRLSRNPVLLYNIAFTMDEAKQELALFYYQKFLKDAPANAPQRAAATDRVKVLEQQQLDASLNGNNSAANPTTNPPTDGGATTKPPTPPIDTPSAPVKIKPAGTYKPEDFQHQTVDEAPPGKPLDLSASVPADSGWVVTLNYRTAGESKFNAKVMKLRYKELVARIPAKEMTGSAIQYYLEVKDQTGAVITRSGKSTSPNLINIDASAQPRFYPDVADSDASPKTTDAQPAHKTEKDEDPLAAGTPHPQPIVEDNPEHPPEHDGFRDVGSTKFRDAKWGATGAAVVLLGTSVYFHIVAGKQASALLADTTTGDNGPCTAPCRQYDSYDDGLQSAGKRDQTIANVTLGVGIAGAVVAGYFWYRELGHKHETKPSDPAPTDTTWLLTPTVGDGFGGAAAVGRF